MLPISGAGLSGKAKCCGTRSIQHSPCSSNPHVLSNTHRAAATPTFLVVTKTLHYAPFSKMAAESRIKKFTPVCVATDLCDLRSASASSSSSNEVFFSDLLFFFLNSNFVLVNVK